MKTELTSESLKTFRKQFGSLHDSIIHGIDYHPVIKSRKSKLLKITIGAPDILKKPQRVGFYEYVNVILEFENVEQVHLRAPHNYEIGIIFSSNIAFYDDRIYVDLHPFDDNPKSPDDFHHSESDKGSVFVIVAKRCFWSVQPYEEFDDT